MLSDSILKKKIGKKLVKKLHYLINLITWNFLYIKAIHKLSGGAASLFGLNYRDVITIKFN